MPIVTSSTYTEDDNRLLSTEDAAGNITRYGYNPRDKGTVLLSPA